MSDMSELLDRPKSRRYARRVRSTTRQLAEAVESCRDDISAILARKHLTEPSKAQRISERRAELLEAVDRIEAKAEANLEIARSGAPSRKMPKDAGEAQLLESRKARAWARAEKMLDAGRDPVAVAQFFADQGDRLALDAMQEELPLWCELNGATGATDDIKAVAEIGEPLLSPEEREAALGVREAERAATDLKTNLGLVRLEAENVYVLSGENDDGTAVTLDLGTFAPREGSDQARGQARTHGGVLAEVLRGGTYVGEAEED